MESCGPLCYALDTVCLPCPESAPKCATRAFYKNREKWMGRTDLEMIWIVQCRHAPIPDEDLAFLADLPPAIDDLDIYCDVSDETVELIADVVRKSKIASLKIVSNRITARSYAAIARAFEVNTSVDHLELVNPAVPVSTDIIYPLFVHALVVNPNRASHSSWVFTRNRNCGDFVPIRDIAQGVSYIFEVRQQLKKQKARAAQLLKVQPIDFKKKMRRLRKMRQVQLK